MVGWCNITKNFDFLPPNLTVAGVLKAVNDSGGYDSTQPTMMPEEMTTVQL